jgi:hypothetical protein
MLSQTKEEVQMLINKVQVLDFVMGSLNVNHKDFANRIEEQYKQASNHKLKLTAEILRLSGASIVESAIEAETVK